MNNLLKILTAMIIATIMGITYKDIYLFQAFILPASKLLGQLFLNALMMVVLPLVITSIILGVSKLGKDSQMKKLAMLGFGSFAMNSFAAVLLGWLSFSMFSGYIHIDEGLLKSLSSHSAGLSTTHSIQSFILKLVPKNIFRALAEGDMLGIILFSLLFGFFLNQLDHETSSPVKAVLNGCFQSVLKMTHWIMKALTPAVFFLVLDASSKLEISTLTALAVLLLILLVGYAAHMFLFWGIALKAFANISLKKHLKAVSPALFTAFSTSSSAATYPVTLESLEKNVGISNKSCSFILPLGSSINMAGTAMYACVGALFLSKIYGITLTFNTQLTIVFLSFFSSFAIAGVPSACLIALLIVLQAVGVPSEAISIVIGLERFIDMIRTTVNVYGNTACLSLVAAYQNESLHTQVRD